MPSRRLRARFWICSPDVAPLRSSVRGVHRVSARRASPQSPRSVASPSSTRDAASEIVVGAVSAKAPRPVIANDSRRPLHASVGLVASSPPRKAARTWLSRVIVASTSRRCAPRVPARVAATVSAIEVGGLPLPTATPRACSVAATGLLMSVPASPRRVSSRTYTFDGSARFAPMSATRPAGDWNVPVRLAVPSTRPASCQPKGFATTERLGARKAMSIASPTRPKLPFASTCASPSDTATSAFAMRFLSPDR